MAMTKGKLIDRAKAMGVEVRWALERRVQYLVDKQDDERKYIETLIDSVMDGNNEVTQAFLSSQIRNTEVEVNRLEREIKTLTEVPREGEITDDMIETAREHPIGNLIDFSRGNRCKAFCHDSDSDSMVKPRSGNYAWCHVCSSAYGSIDVLMLRDGMSFVDAVKSLT